MTTATTSSLDQRAALTAPAVPAPTDNRRTLRFERDHGPLVVDVWEPRHPSPDAPPVLLVHGWGGTGTYWTSTAAALSATVRVIVPDLPGTGRSQPVRAAQDMFDQVATLGALLDELGLERVQVVGHSMGGAMALLLTDAQPDRVTRLVLTSLSFFVSEREQQIFRTVMSAFRLTMSFRPAWLAEVPGLPGLIAQRYFYRVPDDPALLRQGLQDYLELDAGTAAACAGDAPDSAIPAAGARIRVPTLLVVCRQDQVMPPQNVDYTARMIPGCEVVWIDRCGHMPMVEKPARYLEIVQEFLTL